MEFSTVSPPWKMTIGDISQKQEETGEISIEKPVSVAIDKLANEMK